MPNPWPALLADHTLQARFRRGRLAIGGLLILGVLGGWSVYHATYWGPWAFSDGAGYIAAARNLVRGIGLGLVDQSGQFSPTISHPPLFVLVLAGLTKLGLDPLQAARWLHIALFAITVPGAALVLRKLTRSTWIGLIGGGLFLVSPQVTLLFASAMSEPLFLVTGFASLFLLAFYLTYQDWRTLMASSVLAGLAMLTRYPGLAFAATIAIVILAFGPGRLRSRFQRASLSLGVSLLPVATFLVWASWRLPIEPFRTSALPTDVGPALRSFVTGLAGALWTWKPLPPPEVMELLFSSSVAYPGMVVLVALGGACLAIVIGFSAANLPRKVLKGAPAGNAALLKVNAAFVPVYLLVFLAAFLFSDPRPDVDARTMLPLFPALFLLLISTVRAALHGSQMGWKAGLAAAGFATVLAGFLPSTLDIVTGLHRTGSGYTSRAWSTSPTLAYALQISPEVPLITNAAEAMLLYTGQMPYRLPTGERAASRAFGEGSSPAEAAYRYQSGLVVLFEDPGLDGLRDSSTEDLLRYHSMLAESDMTFRFRDGSVYAFPR